MGEATKQANDKGIGEGNLSRERGAPPYADRAYAGEQEPSGETGTSLEGTAGGANVSEQGGAASSDKTGGNASSSGAEGSSSK